MNIVLISPPTITSSKSVLHDAALPIGVAYLAAMLIDAGHDVQIIDALGEALLRYEPVPQNAAVLRHGLSDEEVIARIPADVNMIGVSCMFSVSWPYVRDMTNKIREHFPDATIVAGGEHVTASTAYVLQDCPAVDFCVRGEGEETIVELVTALEKGTSLEAVDGIAYRQDNGQAFLTAPRKRVREVDNLPRPAWDLVPIHKYMDAGIGSGVNLGRSMPIVASRGCPYQCTFCSNPVMWGNLWRARPPQDVVAEIEYYIEKYNATNFDFYDLTAIVRKDWIVEMATLLIEKELNITWQLPSGTRSEAIDAEVSRLLYESGCRYLTYAPESGSEEMLKKIKKVIKKDRMLKSMRDAVRNNLSIKANIIIGFPGETYRHILQTYGFIIQMAITGIDDLSVFSFSPYPGSELYEDLVRQGRITLNDDHLYGLAMYADPTMITSYSEHISDRNIRFLMLFGMALFYITSYTLRPFRFIKLLRNLYQRKPQTKLAVALERLRVHMETSSAK